MSSASFDNYVSIPRSPDLSRLSPLGKSRTLSARPSGSRSSPCSSSHVDLMPHTDAPSTPGDVSGSLITFPIPTRPTRPLKLSPGPDPKLNTLHHSAIPHSYTTYTPDQDVFRDPELLNYRPISHRPGPSSNPGHQVHSPLLLESSQLSSSSTRHAAINSHNARLTTSNQVFNNISDLAAHYGIPQFLPVAPRTTPRRINASEAPSSTQIDISSSPDFLNLCSNYLAMLSDKPSENGSPDVQVEDTAPLEAVPAVTEADAIRSLMDVLNATPELQMANDLNEYLTSPLIDSPLDDDLLTTPAMGSDIHADILTSPLMMDYGNDSFGGEFPSLFEEFDQAMYQQPKPQNEPDFPRPPDFNGMYSLESPNTPMLDSPSTSPLDRQVAPLPKRKSTSTGTRKNITVEALVPIDAPTQSRSYLTPSATSRKQLPATFRRKRARAAGPGDEEDELHEEMLPTLSEQEQIEAKRRQNTVAARRSRARKQQHLQQLEDKIELYEKEINLWKQRALTCQAVLRSHNVQCDQTKEQW